MDQTELRVARFCGREEAHEARCVPGRDGGMEDVVALIDVAAPKPASAVETLGSSHRAASFRYG